MVIEGRTSLVWASIEIPMLVLIYLHSCSWAPNQTPPHQSRHLVMVRTVYGLGCLTDVVTNKPPAMKFSTVAAPTINGRLVFAVLFHLAVIIFLAIVEHVEFGQLYHTRPTVQILC